MILSDLISSEYRMLVGGKTTSTVPSHFKPTILIGDYDRGYISRCCIVKRNNITDGYEIDPSISDSIDNRLYYIIKFTWRISGKKNRTVVNGIIEDFGVEEANQDVIKKQTISISRFFQNPLEFWRGK